MKLTDLIIVSLENVLEYLALGHLLNAASSNKRLNQAANFVFVHRYHINKRRVRFQEFQVSRHRQFKCDYCDSYCIWICDLKTSLQILGCFGQLIPTIRIYFSNQEEPTQNHIIDYMNKYCSDPLITITIRNSRKR